VEPSERIEFRDDQDLLIASFELPGTNEGIPGAGEDGFVGLIVCPGTPAIASVVVLEGDTVNPSQNDDTGYSNIVYVPEPGAVPALLAGSLLLACASQLRRSAAKGLDQTLCGRHAIGSRARRVGAGADVQPRREARSC
jgi:hypothetical protein